MPNTYNLSATTAITLSDLAAAIDSIGRYQLGDLVPILLETPALTDILPSFGISGPNGYGASGLIPCVSRTIPPIYSYPFRLGGGLPLGTYSVTIAFSISGVSSTRTFTFDVVGGGDSGGDVISIYHYDGAQAGYVLAQLSSGKLVQGKNPSL